jgi:hypothetical protein
MKHSFRLLVGVSFFCLCANTSILTQHFLHKHNLPQHFFDPAALTRSLSDALAPGVLEPGRRQFGVAHGVLYRPMPEPILNYKHDIEAKEKIFFASETAHEWQAQLIGHTNTIASPASSLLPHRPG